jgi:hypothetical protein
VGQTKVYKIGIYCFSAKHAALRRKSKDRLAKKKLLQQIILIMPYIALYLSFGKHIFSS